MRILSGAVLTVASTAVLLWAPRTEIYAQGPGPLPPQAVGPPEWALAMRHDKSRALREIAPTPAVSTREDFEVKQAPPSPQAGQVDQAAQSIVVAPLAAINGTSFDGVGEGNPQFAYNVNSAPPDTTGEAGLTQYVQWVNAAFAIFDKTTGTKVYGPAGGNTLWQGFGGPCETRNDGDPIVQYDHLANRWVMTQFALQSGNYQQCVAVSETDNALGAWYRYAFSYAEFPDYPKLSVWPNAYVITFNMFGANGSSFTGGRVCAYDRARMLSGQPATQICQQIPYASLLAADLDGQTLPPAGTPNYVLNRGSNSLNLWRFSPNFVTPASTTFVGPSVIPVAGFSAACSQACIPQPGTAQKLDALGDRLMYRLSYRNLGTREALVVNHSVVTGGITGIRWYELDVTNGVPSVRQQSTYAPADAQHRWMGSVAMDRTGNIAIGYTVGSSTVKPSIRFAGRDVNDPLNTLSMDDNLQTGGGSQTQGLSRWGDYSTMAVDPVDDCTFWYTSEYLQANGTFNWSTRVGSFKFASCGTTPPAEPTFSLAASPAAQSVTRGGTAVFTATVAPVNGYAGSGTFSVSDLPGGATGSFSPATFSGGAGSSSLTIVTNGTTATGSFPITITATDANGGPVQSTIVTLTVAPAVTPDFTINASPGSRVIKRGGSGSYTVTVSPTGGFAETVTFSVTGGPANTPLTFSPTSVAGGGTSTLTVQTNNPSTPKGTFTLTITGTSGSLTRSTTVTLRVN